MCVLQLCVHVRVWVRVRAVFFVPQSESVKCAPARAEERGGGTTSQSSQFCAPLVWNRPVDQDVARGLTNLLGMTVAQAPGQNVSGSLARREPFARTYFGSLSRRDGPRGGPVRGTTSATDGDSVDHRRPRSWSIPGQAAGMFPTAPRRIPKILAQTFVDSMAG